MIFTEDSVDIPDELLSSLAEGRLVLFVGAGISAQTFPAQPSETFYPLFPDLARQVANHLGYVLSTQEERDVEAGFADRVLGTIDANAGDVKSIASAILSNRFGEQRIDCHRAIVRLVSTSRRPQIVTTNFDQLLERALREEGEESNPAWKVFVTPSLPPLRRFSGLCYLHGRVAVPDDLVLTDKHIGRAYMDEGWALRFAHALFRERDVLFVGYSLDDPPLRYLSLALEGESACRRWAFVKRPESPSEQESQERDWQRRNVSPLWYAAPSNDFRALERTVATWAQNASRTFLDRRNLLSLYANADPNNLAPHDLDLARYFLRDTATLRDFARNELHWRWLEKLMTWGLLENILKFGSGQSDATGSLLQRLAVWLASDPVQICGLLRSHRFTLHPGLFDQLCRAGYATSLPIGTLRQLLEFFRPPLEQSHGFLGFAFLENVVERLIRESCLDDALWLLGLQLRVHSAVTVKANSQYEYARLEGQDTTNIPQQVLRFELRYEDQLADHRFKNIVRKELLPRIKEIGMPAMYWLTSKYLELRSIEARGKGRPLPAEFVRSAIEDHEQDRYRHDPVNTLLVAQRDLWERLLIDAPEIAAQVCTYWATISDPMIERLRIHALRLTVEAANGSH